MSGITSKDVGVNLQTQKRILDGLFCKGDIHEGFLWRKCEFSYSVCFDI